MSLDGTENSYGNSWSFGRYGKHSQNYVEQTMKGFAKYTWWDDLNGDFKRNYNQFNHGTICWTQNRSMYNDEAYVLRGSQGKYYGAAMTYHYNQHETYQYIGNGAYSYYGWLPLLEEIK